MMGGSSSDLQPLSLPSHFQEIPDFSYIKGSAWLARAGNAGAGDAGAGDVGAAACPRAMARMDPGRAGQCGYEEP